MATQSTILKKQLKTVETAIKYVKGKDHKVLNEEIKSLKKRIKLTRADKNKNKIERYKLAPEILPFCSQYLAPRHHLNLKKIRKLRGEELGGEFCEVCDSIEKLDVHESFEILNPILDYFIFKVTGFHLLCKQCHKKVHSTKVIYDTHDLLFEIENGIKTQTGNPIPHLYNHFKVNFNEKDFLQLYYERLKKAFEFSLSEEIHCDYSIVSKYGFDKEVIEKKFKEAYKATANKYKYLIDFHRWAYLVPCMRFSKVEITRKRRNAANPYHCRLLIELSLILTTLDAALDTKLLSRQGLFNERVNVLEMYRETVLDPKKN